jgi:hypothetical protein
MKKFKQIKILLILVFLAVTSVVLNSCYPDYGLTVSDFDIVSTFKDDTNDFQAYKTNGATFFMPDTIKKVLGGGIISNNGGTYDQQVLKEIKNQMIAYGYTQDPNPTTADVILYVANWSSTTISYYPGYWGGYYGWYYPWYGYGGYSYSYTTGTLFITMVDRIKIDAQNPGAVWIAAVNGVLDNSTAANIQTRVINSIDKMFSQSPYLKIIE